MFACLACLTGCASVFYFAKRILLASRTCWQGTIHVPVIVWLAGLCVKSEFLDILDIFLIENAGAILLESADRVGSVNHFD
jgi:hypothetical protein